MGKRELLLIVAFAIVGAIVYQFTAPPPAPGERSFSFSQVFENIRREMRGNRSSAESTNTGSHAVGGAITELRFACPRGCPMELTLVGDERADIASEVKVRSNAADDVEARRTATATVLKVEQAGNRLVASIDYPREGRQTASVTLHVPSRLRVKIEALRNRARISNVAGVEIDGGRGTTEIRQVTGRVAGNYRGGELRIIGAGSVKLSTVGTDVRLEQIAGDTSVNMRAGDLKAAALHGPIDMDTTGVDIELEKLEKITGMIRITTTAGSLSINGLRSEARIDARNTDVEAVIDRAAPLAIYGEGGSPIEITPPSGGYQLDAVATNGDIHVPEGLIEVAAAGEGHRASGPVNGGGPTITIRTSQASITVRAREATENSGGNGAKR